MSPVPEWLEHARPNADHKKLHPALDLENYCMEPKTLLKPEAFGLSASEGNKICELRLRTYLDRPLIEIVRQFGKDEALSEYVYAKDSIPHRFVLTRPGHRTITKKALWFTDTALAYLANKGI